MANKTSLMDSLRDFFMGTPKDGAEAPFGLSSYAKGATDNVFVIANGNFFVVFSNAKLVEINGKNPSAVGFSQWAVVGHSQKNVVNRQL